MQAGLRTDYLFRLANQRGGIVLGTGDLSELALGWCTYGVGDQMSHYNVNGGVPKTLIQHLIRWVIASGQFDGRRPTTCCGTIARHRDHPRAGPAPRRASEPQSTEDTVGPYALQDFTLFHVLRHGYPAVEDRVPGLARLARRRGGGVAARVTRRTGVPPTTWPRSGAGSQVFVQRFFAQPVQALGAAERAEGRAGGRLSPRGDWRMPSDASAAAWLADLEAHVPSSHPRVVRLRSVCSSRRQPRGQTASRHGRVGRRVS